MRPHFHNPCFPGWNARSKLQNSFESYNHVLFFKTKSVTKHFLLWLLHLAGHSSGKWPSKILMFCHTNKVKDFQLTLPANRPTKCQQNVRISNMSANIWVHANRMWCVNARHVCPCQQNMSKNVNQSACTPENSFTGLMTALVALQTVV